MNIISENVVNSIIETEAVAKEFAKNISAGDVITLIGNLGAGKTQFTKAFCKNFGIDDVVSPSFAIVNQYDGNLKFYHFDFYRLKSSKELLDIGYYDYLNDDESVTFIEWADMFNEVIPSRHYEVKIDILGDSKRKISVIYYE